MNPTEQSVLRLKKAVLIAAGILLAVAIAMIVLMNTGTIFTTGEKTPSEMERQLGDPANAGQAESIRSDREELRRLETFRKDITGNIEKFGTNSPEGKFMQKEMQRLEQNVKMRQTRIEETKRNLK